MLSSSENGFDGKGLLMSLGAGEERDLVGGEG